MNYTYILECDNGSLYTGWTNDLKKRFKAHLNGTGAKYTKVHKPICLAYYEEYETPQEAMSREWHIKQLTHVEKQKLIDSFDPKKRIERDEYEK